MARGGAERGPRHETHPDAEVARVAAAHDGVVTTAHLLGAGLGHNAIAHRVHTRALRRIHRGVYLVGPVPGPLCRETAALFACGPGAVLSHVSALALWGLREAGDIVHVTRPSSGRRCDGIRLHRSNLPAHDITRHRGLPLTTPARTLNDLAPSLPQFALARLVEEAEIRRLAARSELEASPRLHKAVVTEPALTRSEAERRLLRLIRRAHLPHPQANVRIGRYEVDMLWPRQRVIAEVDGYAFHGSRAAFERDRRRDAQLQALGYAVLRITWRRLEQEPEAILAQLAVLLSAARPA